LVTLGIGMLAARLASSAVFISFIVLSLVLDHWYPIGSVHGIWLMPMLLLFGGATAFEMASALSQAAEGCGADGSIASESTPGQSSIDRYQATILALLPMLTAALPWFYRWIMNRPYPANCPLSVPGLLVAGMLAAFGVASLLLLWRYGDQGAVAVKRWLIHLSVVGYIGIPISFWVLLRQIEPSWFGLLAGIGVVGVTKLADVGAYFFGKAFGKRKLCLSISPGKSVEGAMGGAITALVAALCWFGWWLPGLVAAQASTWQVAGAALMGLLLFATGLMGDLLESTVKRYSGIKDSSRWLPGLGGIWDITDALIPACVVGYYCLASGLVWRP
jgi:phosphatidate cytidylyltransferase